MGAKAGLGDRGGKGEQRDYWPIDHAVCCRLPRSNESTPAYRSVIEMTFPGSSSGRLPK